MIIRRLLRDDVLSHLRLFPAVALIGPRQVGKTTLALSLSNELQESIRYFDLERREDQERIEADPGYFLEQFKDELIILDEVQRMPELFPELRSLIDRDRRPGRFLLLGSASPLLLQSTSESLAGRISYLTLEPLHLTELSEGLDLLSLWWRGGFPDSLLASRDADSWLWRQEFIRTYAERDLALLGLQTNILKLRTFLRMLAVHQGQLWNAESLGRALGVSGNQIKRYLHFLQSSFFVRILPPYTKNIGKRLIKSPKVYIRDSGLLHSLMGLSSPGDLSIHPIVGASWEGFVVQQILQFLPSEVEATFYRTSNGAECDLVLSKGNTVFVCIEIKLGNRPHLTRGFHSAHKDLGEPNTLIITSNSDTYRLKNGMIVISLANCFPQLKEWLS